MPKGLLEELLRKPVVVRANGIYYRGILVEVAPDAIVLRTKMSQISIAMDRIVSLRGQNVKKRKGPAKIIDPSFFE